MRIYFADVGRGKRAWTLDLPGAVDDLGDGHLFSMLRSIKSNGGLASKCIDIAIDSTGCAGFIAAGFHTVGRWHAEDVQP
jgi:hypothetical protein